MFIVLPVGMNYRTERLPIVTLTLIGINTLVYLVSLFFFFSTEGGSEEWIQQHLWLIPAVSYPWMYLTSMFVHAGIFHLLGNMIFLFLFGCCVEDIIGRLRFAIFYLVSGIVAEITFIAVSPDHFASMIPMGGASGAITACMGMYVLLRTGADIEFKYWYFLFLFYAGAGSGEFSVPAWVAISAWFLKDLFWMLLGFYYREGGGGVAFGAHVGGFLAGLALVGFYKGIVERREEPAADLGIAPVSTIAVPAAARPISASETPAIFLYETGKQSGPFTLSQIQAMLSCGSIGKDTLYWSEGMSEWQNIMELSSQPVE
jgi:membrane associated rhomboid family serine protease